MDTINSQDLNASVYYRIAAVDQRQNQSELSQPLEILKPDKTAPSVPVITESKTVQTRNLPGMDKQQQPGCPKT